MSFILVRKPSETAAPAAVMTEEEKAAAAKAMERKVAEQVAATVAEARVAAEAEGRAAGEAAAQAAAAATRIDQEKAVTAAVSAFSAAAAELTAPLAHKEQDLALLVTELAFLLARHIIRQEVSLRPQSLSGLVAELLEEATRERQSGQTIIVRLHPQDHALIAPQFDLPQVHLLADAQIERGGTLVELLTQDGDPIDKVEWDGRIGSRIEALRHALLGHDDGDRAAEAPPALQPDAAPPSVPRPPPDTDAIERTEAA